MSELHAAAQASPTSGVSPELARLLDAAVARLSLHRRTFTDREALADIWSAGFDVVAQIDPRFTLADETDAAHPRQWRLVTQTVANNRLLDALNAGQWDGHDVDDELVRLDAADGVFYVFYPNDSRLTQRPNGVWEPADREPDVALPPATQAELDALGPALLDRWREAGAEPWTVRQILDTFTALLWSEAGERKSWLLIRAWLLRRSDISRVGQDYWIMSDRLPHVSEHTPLRVMPVKARPKTVPNPAAYQEAGVHHAPNADEESGATGKTDEEDLSSLPSWTLLSTGEQSAGIVASWSVTLRTTNLIEGYLTVPKVSRGAYPPRAGGGQTWDVIRGKWFDTGDDLWIWLDRDHDRLCGPDLADKVAWCEAGERLHIAWAQGIIILRPRGVDADVQAEETRLVDTEALAALRGGLGESYRQSLQAILIDAPGGLAFIDLVTRIRERQKHQVHRGTVRALLSAGGFVQRDSRWFAAPDPTDGARSLRKALVQSLVTSHHVDTGVVALASDLDLPATVHAIHDRLRTLVEKLRSNHDHIP